MISKKYFKLDRKGFTLAELLLALGLMSMIILITVNLMIFSMKTSESTITEYSIQQNIRLMSQKINNIIRDSSGLFILYREDGKKLTEEWNYIMVSDDGTRLVEYVWDYANKKHTPKDLLGGEDSDDIKLEFTRLVDIDGEYVDDATIAEDTNSDKVLKFKVDIIFNGKKRSISSILEARNALQVIDRSYINIGNTLAYRSDSRLSDGSNSQAVVSMVIDTSGSMRYTLRGGSANDGSSNTANHSREKLMKQEAIRLLDGLSEKPNIHMGIAAFNSTANGPSEMKLTGKGADYNYLKNQISNINTDYSRNTNLGGTNTGDGIRRGYYQIKEFNEDPRNMNKTNKNFMIILVDGVTTFASVHEVKSQEISFRSHQGNYVTKDGLRYEYDRTVRNFLWSTYYYKHVDPIYVEGNSNISPQWLKSDNVKSGTGSFYGNGQRTDTISEMYVDRMGELVKSYKEGTNEEITVYVIGFSALESDHGSLEDIAMATRGDKDIHKAGDSEALERILRSIQKEINDSLWHIGGPN